MELSLPSKDFFFARQWRGRPYLISPFFDLMMAGGAAVLCFAVLRIFLPLHAEDFDSGVFYVTALAVWLAFFVNDPHFITSYQLLYRNYGAKLRRFRGHRELWLRYIVAGIVVPAGMALYFIYALVAQRMELFAYAIVTMLFVVGWHYAKQAYGVFIVLSAMKKVYYARWQRWFFLCNSYIFWLFYCVGIILEKSIDLSGMKNVWGVDYELPANITLSPLLSELLGGAFLFFGLGSIIVAAWGRKNYSRTGLVAYLSMYYLLLLGAFHPLWIVLYPFFHSLQYLMFVYAYKRGEAITRCAEAQSEQQHQAIRADMRRFILIAFVVGILGFAAIPLTLEGLINPDNSFLFPLTVIFIVFINIHHYFIDNVIWRKEHEEVGRYLFA